MFGHVIYLKKEIKQIQSSTNNADIVHSFK